MKKVVFARVAVLMGAGPGVAGHNASLSPIL